MPLIPSIVNWLNVKRLHQINLFKSYPVEVQNEQLDNLVSEASDTSWGKTHGFNKIKT